MRWFVNNTVIKILVVVLCIKEMWLLLGVPSISNAIIQFCTIGLIPGTGASLTPSEMLIASVAISMLLLSLLFRKELKRLLKQHGVIVLERLEEPQKPAQVLPSHPIRLYPQQQQLVRVRSWAEATLEFWFWSIIVACLEITRVVVAVSVVIWQLSEPYVRKFDRWLDVQLHNYEPAAKVLALGSEAADSLQIWFMKAKNTYEASTSSGHIDKSDQHSS